MRRSYRRIHRHRPPGPRQKTRPAPLAATAVKPAGLRPTGRGHDHRCRTKDPARHHCSIRAGRAPIVPIPHTIFCALAQTPLPLPSPAFPSRCARPDAMPAAAAKTVLRRLRRTALRRLRAEPGACQKANERGHRMGVPPSRFAPGEPRRTVPPAGITASRSCLPSTGADRKRQQENGTTDPAR